MVCDWFQVQVLCFCPSDWFLIVPKIPLQISLCWNQWLSKWVCTYFLFELCLWELFLIEEIGSKDWVFRVVFEKIQIIFLGCFVWFFVLFHVLTINALGCHINFKPFFFFFPWFMNIDIGKEKTISTQNQNIKQFNSFILCFKLFDSLNLAL